jgi:metal-dependent hydrolase (beta-lactamase superfamily II)
MKYAIKFLPARYGDCIWIEYGNQDSLKRILIDGGTGGTKKNIKALIKELPKEERVFELMVITHIDRDHIEGILSLLEEDELNFSVRSVWFNGWNHLPENNLAEPFGAVQGERLTGALLKHKLPWNTHFGGKAVVLPDNGLLPVFELTGGMKLTLLSPSKKNLEALRVDWEKEVRKAGLEPGFGLEEPENLDEVEVFGLQIPDVERLCKEDFHEDKSSANGSSIAFLLDYGGKRALFAGDSFPGIIVNSLNQLSQGKIDIDLFKLSHHASGHNTSPELLEKVNCSNYIISTNGSIYHHPAEVTMARLVKFKGHGSNLYFNYKTKYNEIWDDEELKEVYNYSVIYPETEGVQIHLL